jgi:hypothetical protein
MELRINSATNVLELEEKILKINIDAKVQVLHEPGATLAHWRLLTKLRCKKIEFTFQGTREDEPRLCMGLLDTWKCKFLNVSRNMPLISRMSQIENLEEIRFLEPGIRLFAADAEQQQKGSCRKTVALLFHDFDLKMLRNVFSFFPSNVVFDALFFCFSRRVVPKAFREIEKLLCQKNQSMECLECPATLTDEFFRCMRNHLFQMYGVNVFTHHLYKFTFPNLEEIFLHLPFRPRAKKQKQLMEKNIVHLINHHPHLTICNINIFKKDEMPIFQVLPFPLWNVPLNNEHLQILSLAIENVFLPHHLAHLPSLVFLMVNMDFSTLKKKRQWLLFFKNQNNLPRLRVFHFAVSNCSYFEHLKVITKVISLRPMMNKVDHIFNVSPRSGNVTFMKHAHQNYRKLLIFVSRMQGPLMPLFYQNISRHIRIDYEFAFPLIFDPMFEKK